MLLGKVAIHCYFFKLYCYRHNQIWHTFVLFYANFRDRGVHVDHLKILIVIHLFRQIVSIDIRSYLCYCSHICIMECTLHV